MLAPWLGRVVRFLIVLSLLLPVCLWAGLRWGAEKHWLTASLQYAPFYGWLFPVCLAWLLAWTQTWLWRLLATLGLVIVLFPVMGFVCPSSDSGSGHIRLMTYNIKAFKLMDQPGKLAPLAWEIAAHDPDILFMQDAGGAGAEDVPMGPEAKRLVGDRQVFAAGQYIMASRFPLKDCGVGRIDYFRESHTFLHCTVTVHGEEIDLVTVHFLSPRDGLNALREHHAAGRQAWTKNFQSRLIQSNQLTAQLKGRQRRLIVAGDLNAPEHSQVVQNLTGLGLRDAFSAAGFGYGYTHGHSLKPGISINRIDHILVSSDLGVKDCFTGGKEASEHRPVIADLVVHREH